MSALLTNPEITDLRDLFSDHDEITNPAVKFADALIEAMANANIPKDQHLAVIAAWAGLLANPEITEFITNGGQMQAEEAIKFAKALNKDLKL